MTPTARRKDLLAFGQHNTFGSVQESDPGNSKDVLDETMTNDIFLTQIFADAGQPGRVLIYKKPVSSPEILVGGGRITEASPNFFYSWSPILPIAKDERIIVRFEALAGRPVTNINTFLQTAQP